jgi:predicted PurR-regulated permease PerM
MATRSSENMIHVSSGTILRIVFILALCYAIYLLRDIALVVILSVVVASAIEPGTKWLSRRGVPRLLSVILIYAMLALFLIGMVYFLFLPMLSETVSFLASLPSYLADLRVWNPLESNSFLNSQEGLGNLSQSFSLADIVSQLDDTINRFSKGFFSTVSAIFGGALSFVLVLVLSFYLSVEPNGVTKFLRIVIPSKHEAYIVDLWQRSQTKIGLWMQGQIILAIIVAVLVFLGLTLLRIENALLLAVVAGIFELIPLFGPILAAIPAVALALLSGGGVTPALLVVGLYVIVQQFENQLIYPLVVRKIVGVPPIVSILALIVGGKLAGFIGIVISVPIAAVIMEFFNDLEKDKMAKAERLKEALS